MQNSGLGVTRLGRDNQTERNSARGLEKQVGVGSDKKQLVTLLVVVVR